MKIALISMQMIEAPNYSELRNAIACDYIRYFEQMGYMIILVPNGTSHIEKYFKEVDINLVVLTGGNNIDPLMFGNSKLMSDIYPVRDETEQKMIRLSIKRNVKLLGICRGFQLINVYFGGKIKPIQKHVAKGHILKSTLDFLDGEDVNSYHEYGVVKNDLAPDLEILAEVNGGIIESYKHKKYKILAIQWHPERQNCNSDKELIRQFLKDEL